MELRITNRVAMTKTSLYTGDLELALPQLKEYILIALGLASHFSPHCHDRSGCGIKLSW